MQEYRCKFCHRLLFKCPELTNKDDWIQIEIKCPKCGKKNRIFITSKEVAERIRQQQEANKLCNSRI